MRKDAAQNRERLLRAARRLFADQGLDVPLEEIARSAGVSIGTLYNRFPTRGALVDAAFADRMAIVDGLAEQALAMDDAWEGFVAFLTGVCELQAVDLGYNELAARGAAVDWERGYGLMSGILERAQRSGDLRDDITLADVAFVARGVTAIIKATYRVAPGAWRRHLALALDGLRAVAARPLPVPPLSAEQTRATMGEDC
ncbi:TetR/AcrR family transcriptional regulator [Streptosporangium sp. NPDC000509]|uniref:TetR/AcrR family transcriptional regulator n=1 Tax=Streptosporangium sp. NPDC000509 TaxID=3366186 RepID=UPI0036C50D4F